MNRSPSESSLTSGFDERSIDSIFDAPLRSMEAAYQETRDATETPVPDLEEVTFLYNIIKPQLSSAQSRTENQDITYK